MNTIHSTPTPMLHVKKLIHKSTNISRIIKIQIRVHIFSKARIHTDNLFRKQKKL